MEAMMFVVKKEKEEILSIPAKELKPESIKSMSSPLAIKIIQTISEKPMYVIEISKRLKMHEQKIYYHIRKLEQAGVVKKIREEEKMGALAKYYALVEPAYVVAFREFKHTNSINHLGNESSFLEPFIKNGELDSVIVVGSPEPHGPEKARSKDGYFAIDLGLFFGTFLTNVSRIHVKLDTEMRAEDLKQNMVLIGGPVVNKIVAQVNQKMPIRFDPKNHFNIVSTISGKKYPSDECGIILKAKNPFHPQSQVLIVAGKRYSGTRAAVIAFLKHFKEISQGNNHNRNISAKVVEGLDADSDGVVDEIEIRE